ncbi:trimeric intracellular cation channel family protein [Ureibacillus chungkukjangi]|uniref:trimeric intracellular cation channel family protein n=1 Tax=Ureibacillus chungkukjangi TaxID=1202712 RepID=UPI0020417520|nr:trimeric intracellular cation channel family protein [Ureibacillus chungkukjangi]MCM3386952.1 trimeric intracellular cation channel family protein [Ureibacillus chungkukjangi]
MAWEVFSIIGTIAFAISGAIVAMEEEYDLFGVYLLGIVTAFGGGAIRNLLIGLPVSTLWSQEMMFQIAIAAITVFFLVPHHLIKHWNRWGNFTDAIGLSAFAIQGAIFAVSLELPISAVIVAAVLTGSGGGIIRDLLARRKPLVLRDEIYAVWAAGAGLIIGLQLLDGDIFLYALFIVITALRVLSYTKHWKLPVRTLKQTGETESKNTTIKIDTNKRAHR